ncbi:putative disease resistance protein RGA1 [Beta vulgaris subsp. vulgaris]|uniref:putative disease resistance protein RGA1 n=1 Tax=Beta vulgaris subsp. vulgaris TaxID=3555 RepID=UPI002549BE47|nr:putative disease resistance protein RGA1 [Beta vulgaris subsp. vulgaris]
MAEAVLFGVAEEVLKNLGSTALDDIASAWGFKARLEKLKNTISTIKDVLLDAEEKQADSHAVRGWLERLTTAVYAADDLFDEIATVASRRQLMGGNKLTKEVKNFLFPVQSDQEIIGRDGDKKALLDLMFASSSTDDVPEHELLPVISIVGIEGQGKTTLAQLIYNDDQVDIHFELRLWVCVSDIFNVKGIIEKMLMSATNTETPKLDMEQLQGRLRQEIGDRKYFLVLDDVWNEDREEWIKLRALLKIGRKGSMILVTTRSREVANIMSTLPPYQLQGLSEENSWDLFVKMAFMPGQAQKEPHLVKVGKEIINKCANVPLAVRTLGSLLYGKDESKWWSFNDTTLANISENQNNIMSILKLSYHHLWSPLKNCFTYCALFPKDSRYKKEILIDLWMAEGFIIPTNENQSLEDLAEEYFLMLLQRCFFQDIIRNEWGAITSCKMHDLMHDLAQEVAGVKFKVTKFGDSNFNNRIHHLSFNYRLSSSWKIPSCMLDLKLLRTFLLPVQREDGLILGKSTCLEILSNFRCLRVLDLHHLGLQCLPSSICQLIHLRYLNLSVTSIKDLPASVNGAKANLSSKHRLTELHIDLTGLDEDVSDYDIAVMEGLQPHPNLRKLRIGGFRGQKLPSWIMIDNISGSLLLNLVEIRLYRCERCLEVPTFGRLPFLKRLTLENLSSLEYMENDICDLSSSSSLPPPIEAVFFPSLEELMLIGLSNLKGWWKVGAIVNNDKKEVSYQLAQDNLLLMSFSNLSKLWIERCPNLMVLPLSPNVEKLTLVEINKTLAVLKMTTSFPQCSSKLKQLSIDNIEDLISLPKEYMRQLSLLEVQDGNLKAFKSLRYLQLREIPKLVAFPRGLQHLANLRSLEIRFIKDLKELPEWISCFQSLEHIELFDCPKLTSLPEGFRKLTSITQLRIIECPGLAERCQGPNGKDWTKIQHIPLVSIRESIFD